MAKIITKEKLTHIRIKQGYSRAEFAARIGITREALWKIETRRRCPKPETAKKIVDKLGLTFDEIFDIQEGA